MKKLFLLLAVASLCLTACKKDGQNDNGNKTDNGKLVSRIVRYEKSKPSYKSSVSFSYNKNNKIEKISVTDKWSDTDEDSANMTITYNQNKITCVKTGISEGDPFNNVFNMVTDANGNIISSLYTRNDNSTTKYQIKYDKSNYLTEIVDNFEDSPAKHEYKWLQNNLSQILTSDLSEESHLYSNVILNYGNTDNKANLDLSTLALLSYESSNVLYDCVGFPVGFNLGKFSAKMPKQVAEYRDLQASRLSCKSSFEYTLDKDGYITKITEQYTFSSETGTIITEIYYK